MRILSLNSGSSSLKFALYSFEQGESLVLAGRVSRIGLNDSSLKIMDHKEDVLFEKTEVFVDHNSALSVLFEWARRQHVAFDAVGHRIVHGGPRYTEPCELTEDVLKALKEMAPFDPDHLPDEIQTIKFIKENYQTTPQFACFDTAFHASIPERAKYFSIPRKLWDQGIYRYGFHGLSYEYIMQELATSDAELALKNVIIAHLGNGASMAAVSKGKCIDTTMGFTPLGGLIMSTRSGDLDPSVLLYMQKELGMTVDELSRVLNQESGLLGISDLSSDMKDLLEAEKNNPHAKQAIEMFCYQIKKAIGAYQAILDGLDCLIFTGGIGENADSIRERICKGLENVPIKVIKTNEELMIARHVYQFMKGENNGANN